MVTVYSKENCLQCEYTKKYLSERGVAFKTISLDENPEAVETVKLYGYKQAPVVVNDETREHWSGFQPDKLATLIS